MYCKVNCGTLLGIKGTLIEVEVDIADGLPIFSVVGMPSNTIQEAKERVRTGIRNAGFNFPYKRITINLAPAHIRKEGVGFDLAIAVGILCAERVINQEALNDTMIFGELALNGEIRPIRGVLSLVAEGAKQGMKRCVLPANNMQEASMIKDIEIIGAYDLKEVVNILKGYSSGRRIEPKDETMEQKAVQPDENLGVGCIEKIDFNQVVGQKKAKHGLEIAVSGMHHVMLVGPPGIGKTMLARRIKTILPPLNQEEKVELTKIYSAAEKMLLAEMIISERPFRNPHHSITRASFIGGGMNFKPGEISLAHKGVLMLDEFPEFKREVIESLREPLEQGEILLSRNHHVYAFPADFILVAAMNPCPCGHFPNLSKCRCLPSEVERYKSKISGPICDRIDLHVEMNGTSYENLVSTEEIESSKDILERVIKAQEIQQKRYLNYPIAYNSQLTTGLIKYFCKVEPEGEALLEKSYKTLGLSSRSYHRLLKISRTLADMDNAERIKTKHIAGAIMFRSQT